MAAWNSGSFSSNSCFLIACMSSYIWAICSSVEAVSTTIVLPKKNQSRIHTAHLVNLCLVHLFSPPLFALDLLRVALPFCEETDLSPSRSVPLLFSCLDLLFSVQQCAYNVNGILNIPVCPKLALDILITQHTHLRRQVFAMTTE